MSLANPAFNNVIVAIIVIVNFYFIYLTVKSKVEKRLATNFILLSLGISGWIAFAHFSDLTKGHDATLILNRIVFAFLIITGIALLNFPFFFPHKVEKFSTLRRIYNLSGVILAFVTVLTNWFIKDIEIYDWGSSVIDGDYFFIWATFISIGFLSPLQYIFRYKGYSASERQRLKFFILALVVVILANIFVHMVVARLILKTDEAYRWGNYSTIILLVAIGYTIVKHRLFGIRFVVGKSIYIISLSLIPFVTFYGVEVFLRKYLGGIYSSPAIVLGFFFAVLFIYFLFFANTRLNKFVNNKIIHTGFDPDLEREKLVKVISSELHIDKVVTEVLSTIHTTLKPLGSGIILFDLNNRKVLFRRVRELKVKNGVRDLLEIILFWDDINNSLPIIQEEINLGEVEYPKHTKERLERIIHFMKKNKIAAVFPLNRKVQLNGILLLGDKSDETAYTVNDVDFLSSIVANASVAMGRSLLYEQVHDFAENLEKKVDEATQELEKKAKELERKNKALEQVSKRERDMMDIVGHELRTPATIVKNALGYIQMLKRMKKVKKEKVDQYTKKAQEAIEREIKLINTFLGATKVDGGQMQFDPSKFSLPELIKQVIGENKPRAQEKGLKLFYRPFRKALPQIEADRTKIAEVIENLITNAIKYTAKGHIEVWCEAKLRSQTVSVFVKDTGTGISKKDQPKLFTKFGRIRNYTTEKERMAQIVRPGGTGLGLYLAKGIVTLHGGEIGVESKLGKGSTFHFTLPFKHTIAKKNLINPIFKKDGETDVFKKMGFKNSNKSK